MNTTTRTFPRTLNEAFSRTAEYGCAIERPAPLFARSRLASRVIGLVLVASLVALLFINLPGVGK